MDELVSTYDLDDPDGRVTGAAARSVVRAQNLPHAVTAVALRDRHNRIYVHRRTTTKDLYPDMHDAFAGGVVSAGEDPTDAAIRELQEELGVRHTPLRPCLTYWYTDANTRSLIFVFEARYDPRQSGPLAHQPTEVADGLWMTVNELTDRLSDPTWPFVPDGRETLRRYLPTPTPTP